MKNNLCYMCKHVCYDGLFGNGYCNNFCCDNYSKIIITDNEGCTVVKCEFFDFNYDEKGETELSASIFSD